MKNFIALAALAFALAACTEPVRKGPTTSAPPLPEAIGEPNQAQQGSAFSITADAFYQANQAATSSPGVVVSLLLTAKGHYEMTTEHLDKSPMTSDTGHWRTLPNGNLALHHAMKNQKDSVFFEFETAGDKLVSVGKKDGAAGLTLLVRPLPKEN